MSIDTFTRPAGESQRLDLAWLRAQLVRFTYRPGWRLAIDAPYSIVNDWIGDPRLVVEYVAPDSQQPDRTIPLQLTMLIPSEIGWARDETLFAAWLARSLLLAEEHESREWLRRDGQICDDPHAGPGMLGR